MQSWQQAFELAKFELRKSIQSSIKFIIPLLLFMFITSFVVFPSTSIDIEGKSILIDVWLLVMVSFIPLWIRPKEIQYQQINENGVWATPTALLQIQLAIPRNIIVKSRLIIHYISSLPIHAILFVMIYLFSPSLQEMMSIGNFICFLIVWLSFYASMFSSVGDVGYEMSVFKMIFWPLVMMVGLIGLLIFFHFKLGFGIVYGTVLLVKKWPLLSIAIAIVLAIIGSLINYWYMIRLIKRTDYF